MKKKQIVAIGLAAVILCLILYVLLFKFIEPSYNQYENKTITTTLWNQDKDISTIEHSFIFNTSSIFVDDFSLPDMGRKYEVKFSDSKKFTIKPDIDTLIVPICASQRILALHNQYQFDSNPEYLEDIVELAEWLKEVVVIENNCAKWPYPLKFNKYPNLPFDWDGAWALGVHLSGIARTFQITGDSSYLELGDYVLNTFSTLVEENGILSVEDAGNYWYEEYPTVPPSRVLNGHINALFGLYDYWRVTQDPRSKELFDKGTATVAYSLDRYDTGYWSCYDDMYNYVADYKYHKCHINQLDVLYQITQEDTFLNYKNKWEGYFDEPYYTCFKFKVLLDAFHRRLTYKSW